MGREIKFRGMSANSKEIVYGDLIHGVGNKEGRIYILPRKVNLAYVKDCDPLDGVRVVPETLGQFTGLKDKHLKEIYEDDLLKISADYKGNYFGEEGYSYSLYGQVKYMPSKGFYLYIHKKWDEDNDEEIKVENKVGYITQYLSEIIGNIHQDKHLLESKSKSI